MPGISTFRKPQIYIELAKPPNHVYQLGETISGRFRPSSSSSKDVDELSYTFTCVAKNSSPAGTSQTHRIFSYNASCVFSSSHRFHSFDFVISRGDSNSTQVLNVSNKESRSRIISEKVEYGNTRTKDSSLLVTDLDGLDTIPPSSGKFGCGWSVDYKIGVRIQKYKGEILRSNLQFQREIPIRISTIRSPANLSNLDSDANTVILIHQRHSNLLRAFFDIPHRIILDEPFSIPYSIQQILGNQRIYHRIHGRMKLNVESYIEFRGQRHRVGTKSFTLITRDRLEGNERTDSRTPEINLRSDSFQPSFYSKFAYRHYLTITFSLYVFSAPENRGLEEVWRPGQFFLATGLHPDTLNEQSIELELIVLPTTRQKLTRVCSFHPDALPGSRALENLESVQAVDEELSLYTMRQEPQMMDLEEDLPSYNSLFFG